MTHVPSPKVDRRPLGCVAQADVTRSRHPAHDRGSELRQSPTNLRWLTVAILCTISLLILTHLPQDPTPEVLRDSPFHVDKVEHAFAYGVIGICFVLALRRPRGRLLLAVLFAIAVLAVLDEVTQPLVGRSASVWDLLADVAGIALAPLMVLIRRRI